MFSGCGAAEIGTSAIGFSKTRQVAYVACPLPVYVCAEKLSPKGQYEPDDDIPEGTDHPQLYPLTLASNLTNVRVFFFGDEEARAGDDTDSRGVNSCNTSGEGVIGIIKQMPKVEEIRLFAHRVDTKQLFGLQTLSHLRVLQIHHNDSYPLVLLAKNPSLGRLTHLLLHPHAREGDYAYIRLASVKALVNSTNLPSITHLQIRLSDMGDMGVAALIASGILGRLTVLDLQHGCITDAGANALAACANAKNLVNLDLMNNNLTKAGIATLKAAGIKVKVPLQWITGRGGNWGDGDQGYLYAGDME